MPWIAYWVAAKSAADPDHLLGAREKSNSWQDSLTSLQLSPEKYGIRFTQALATDLATDRLAAAVVDELLIDYRLLSNEQLDGLRKLGASNQELILAAVLSNRSRRSAHKIFQDAKFGARTWGSMLQATGIDGQNLHQAVANTLAARSS